MKPKFVESLVEGNLQFRLAMVDRYVSLCRAADCYIAGMRVEDCFVLAKHLMDDELVRAKAPAYQTCDKNTCARSTDYGWLLSELTPAERSALAARMRARRPDLFGKRDP